MMTDFFDANVGYRDKEMQRHSLEMRKALF